MDDISVPAEMQLYATAILTNPFFIDGSGTSFAKIPCELLNNYLTFLEFIFINLLRVQCML